MGQAATLSKTSSVICRIMQLFALLTAAFLIYVGITNQIAENMTNQMVASHWGFLSPEQQATFSDTSKKSILKGIATASWMSPLLIFLGVGRIFGNFAGHGVAARKSFAAMRFLGLMLILDVLVRFFVQPAMLFALTYDSDAGNRLFSVAIDVTQITGLLMGIAIFLIGHFLLRAEHASEEDKFEPEEIEHAIVEEI